MNITFWDLFRSIVVALVFALAISFGMAVIGIVDAARPWFWISFVVILIATLGALIRSNNASMTWIPRFVGITITLIIVAFLFSFFLPNTKAVGEEKVEELDINLATANRPVGITARTQDDLFYTQAELRLDAERNAVFQCITESMSIPEGEQGPTSCGERTGISELTALRWKEILDSSYQVRYEEIRKARGQARSVTTVTQPVSGGNTAEPIQAKAGDTVVSSQSKKWVKICSDDCTVSVSGTVDYGGEVATADGSPRVADRTAVAKGIPFGVLLAKVGEKGKPFQVGSSNTIQAGGNAVYAIVNDSYYSDNKGSYIVSK